MIDNIAVGVFTGFNYYHRAKAVKETWGSYFTHIFFHGYTPHEELRITTLPIQSSHKEDYLSALYKELFGLVQMYHDCPGAEWYFSCGCDTYVHPINLHNALRKFDFRQPFFVGGNCAEIKRREFLDEARLWKLLWFWRFSIPDIRFPSGGAGFALSNELLKTLVPFLEKLPDQWVKLWKQDSPMNPASDVCTASGVYKYSGATVTEVKGFYGHHWIRYVTPVDVCRSALESEGIYERFKDVIGDHASQWPLVDEPISFHYLQPDDMRDLHRRALQGIMPFNKCKLGGLGNR